jgi:hypothetical protein
MPQIKPITGIRDLTYGIEIEFFGTTPNAVLAQMVNVNLACHWTGTYHGNRVHGIWNLCVDRSVNSTGTECGCGLEMVSPILRGTEGLVEVMKVCKAIETAGGKVDKTCGLHVHVGTGMMNLKQLRRVYLRWLQFEPLMETIFSESRRGAQRYAESNLNAIGTGTATLEQKLTNAMHMSEHSHSVDQFFREFCPRGRYYKMNIEPQYTYGTVEFRGHQGSIDGDKITNYIRLMVNFVSVAIASKMPQGKINYDLKYYFKYFTRMDKELQAWFDKRQRELNPAGVPSFRPATHNVTAPAVQTPIPISNDASVTVVRTSTNA